MINLEITASPAVGKKVELEQSIVYFQKSIEKVPSQFEVVTKDSENYQFSFKFETEEETRNLLESSSFTLLSGAIQTLCENSLVTLNAKKIPLEKLNNKKDSII